MSQTTYFDKLTTGVTLTKYMLIEQQKNPEKFEDLVQLMSVIQTAVKAVSNIVRKSGLSQMLGSTKGSYYSQFFDQKLEQLANELIINLLKSSYSTCVLVSGEEEDAIVIEKDKQGKYIVCFDPLDGTSNIESLVPIGSIFSIFKKKSPGSPSHRDALQSGKNVVATGYALYGSATVFVMSAGNGVHEFILDPTIGEFIMTSYSMKMPQSGRIYSINEGYSKYWYGPVQQYIHTLKHPNDGKPLYSSRYIGAMVADIHRTLKYGGIFMYPATKDCPRGKLRLMYECIPMAFLIEQAGGLAVTNSGSPSRILDVTPDSIHQRIPVFMGSKVNLEEMIACFENSKDY